jgi:hypothetical protein
MLGHPLPQLNDTAVGRTDAFNPSLNCLDYTLLYGGLITPHTCCSDSLNHYTAKQRTSVSRISFVDALCWLAQACVQMLPLRLLCNLQRPNRYEPRCRKRRMKEYDLMNIPRKELRKRLVAQEVTA